MPNTDQKYWDGTMAICPKCASNKKYDRNYWEQWRKKKYETPKKEERK